MKVYLRWDYKNDPEFFFHSEKDLCCGDIIKYQGKHYAVGSLDPANKIAEVRLLKSFTDKKEAIDSREYDYAENSDLICPICGKHIDDAPKDSATIECEHCGAELAVEVEYAVYYSPTVLKVPEVVNLDEEK